MNDLEKLEKIFELTERIKEEQGLLLILPFSKFEENIYYVFKDYSPYGSAWTYCKCSYAQMAYLIARGTDKEMFRKTAVEAIDEAIKMQSIYGGRAWIPKKVQELKDFEIEPKVIL